MAECAEVVLAKVVEMADRFPMMAVGHLVEHVVPEARTVAVQPEDEGELEVEIRCVRSKLNTMDVAAHASMDRIVAALRGPERPQEEPERERFTYVRGRFDTMDVPEYYCDGDCIVMRAEDFDRHVVRGSDLSQEDPGELPEGPRCDGCGGPHELNYYVSDEVWERIRPDQDAPPGGGGALCLQCIDDRCAELGLHDVPVRIHFEGKALRSSGSEHPPDDPVVWRRREGRAWVYYESEAWPDMTPLFERPAAPPDEWRVQPEGGEYEVYDSQEEAEEEAAAMRLLFLAEWREAEGDAPYTGPSVEVVPVWIGSPQRSTSHRIVERPGRAALFIYSRAQGKAVMSEGVVVQCERCGCSLGAIECFGWTECDGGRDG